MSIFHQPTTWYTWDDRDRTTQITDALGGMTKFGYDAAGNLLSLTDRLNRITRYSYDALNRLTKLTDPLGYITSYAYDAVGNLTAITDALGRTTEYSYDALNRRTAITNALGDTATTTYDAVGNITAVTDELGRTTGYGYDKRNWQTQIVDALGGITKFGYDAAGNLLSTTDQLNRTIGYSYDALNRRIKVTDALGNSTSLAYDGMGNLTAMTDALGRTTGYSYDALNRRTATIDAVGNTTTTAYDAVGNAIAFTDQLGRTTRFGYDALARRTTVTDPLNQTTTTGYDAIGNAIALTDALGEKTRYSYDALNRQTAVTDALNQTTTTTYDAVGNVLSITDPVGNATSYSYDVLDRLVTDTNALGKSRTYQYDAVGNRIAAVDRNGRKRSFTYDALDRQTAEKWLDANGNVIRTINYNYDAASQLTATGDPAAAYTYTYDAAFRLTSLDNTGTPGVPNVVLGYTYDAVGNRLTVTDTINSQLKGTEVYSYDALNRVTRITTSGNGVANKRVDLAYDAASQMTGLTRYADLAGTQSVANSNYTYDNAGRLTNLTHSRGATTLAAYSWKYDTANRITSFTSPDGISDYNYDAIDQLTSTDHSFQADEAYAYDANGNRTNTGYQTGTNNHLLSDGLYNYEYDNEGNKTKRTSIATGEVTEYKWDYRNRLTQVVTKDASGNVIKSVEYTYDVFNRRLAKSVDPDGAGAAPVQVERMVYDGDNIALTFDGNGTQTHRYLYGPGVDQILADENASGEVVWALSDNQGTVRDIVDSTGTIQNHIIYDSFGQITNQTNPDVDFRFGYTGREFDAQTGQYYYRARYYDATVGRFISEDPTGFAAGDASLYRYVGNSPVNRLDPSGEDWVDVLNKADQFAAGFGDTVSFGATTRIREALYGETATRNHSGGFFNAGQAAGVVASTAVGFGAAGNAARGGGWAIRAAQGYTTVGDAVGAYQSTKNLLSGCFSPADLLGFAPVAGYAGGRALRGLGGINDTTRAVDNAAIGALDNLPINTGGRFGDEIPLTSSTKLDDYTRWIEYAPESYDAIRNTNNDVIDIARSTGWPEYRIQRIKDHLFHKEHQLDYGVSRFDPDPDIADAWARLKKGEHNADDLRLLQHEYFESKFESIFRTNYRTAHDAAIRSGRTWHY